MLFAERLIRLREQGHDGELTVAREDSHPLHRAAAAYPTTSASPALRNLGHQFLAALPRALRGTGQLGTIPDLGASHPN